MFPFFMKKQLEDDRKKIKVSFDKIRGEMEDHLDAINSNTSELQALYEYQCVLESKIDKLLERIEKLELRLGHDEFPMPEISEKERDILATLYLAEHPLTIREISQFTHIPRSLVGNYLSSMLYRKIPLEKIQASTRNGTSEMFALAESFRIMQVKWNVLKIDKDLIKRFN